VTPRLLGQTLSNRFRVDTFVALTPLGEYFRAFDAAHNTPCGLLVPPSEIQQNPQALKELEFRATAAGSLSHANLIKFLGFYRTSRVSFLLEEWIDGPTLRDIFRKSRFALAEALTYARALCAALEHLHNNSWLHLRLAPELIRLDRFGRIRLGGVGAVHPSGEPDLRGFTEYPPLYAAPEQVRAETPTRSADSYGLAVILCESLTGVWITGASAPRSVERIRAAQLDTSPRPPADLNPLIPDHFSRMLLWALRKKPDLRLSTPAELYSSLLLAAGERAERIPARAEPVVAPVTEAVLSSWPYLPAPAPKLLGEKTQPLLDHLPATDASRSRKRRLRAPSRAVMAVGSLAAIILILLQIKPAGLPEIQLARNTPVTTALVAPATVSPVPKAASVHGRRIVFTCTRGDYNQLCMINFDGTDYQRLSNLEASDYYPVFAPAGDSILFASNRNGAFDLYSLTFGDRQLTQLTDHVGNVISPDFSPDGQKVVFANVTAPDPAAIWIMNRDGLNPHVVYAGPHSIVATAWSPDGLQIAYAMSMGIPNEFEIFVMGVDGKGHRRLSVGLLGIGGSVSWSPDGRYILISAGPVGDKDIFRLEVAAGNAVQLTDGGNNAAPSYSPDGLYIAYNSSRNDDQADLYVMKADGSLERRLTDDPEADWGPRWEP